MKHLKRTLIGIGLALIFLAEVAGAVTVSIGEVSGPKGGNVQVPLSFDGATGVGSMDLVLTYDPRVAQAIGTDTGSLTNNAYLESNIGIPGQVKIALADSTGISGNGPVAMITFQCIGEVGSSTTLTIEEATLHDIELTEVAATTRNGMLTVTAGSAVTQAGSGITAIALAAGGLVIGLLFAQRRRQGPS
jgi:hypothetical protein